jgi:hypothetical protein
LETIYIQTSNKLRPQTNIFFLNTVVYKLIDQFTMAKTRTKTKRWVSSVSNQVIYGILATLVMGGIIAAVIAIALDPPDNSVLSTTPAAFVTKPTPTPTPGGTNTKDNTGKESGSVTGIIIGIVAGLLFILGIGGAFYRSVSKGGGVKGPTGETGPKGYTLTRHTPVDTNIKWTAKQKPTKTGMQLIDEKFAPLKKYIPELAAEIKKAMPNVLTGADVQNLNVESKETLNRLTTHFGVNFRDMLREGKTYEEYLEVLEKNTDSIKHQNGPKVANQFGQNKVNIANLMAQYTEMLKKAEPLKYEKIKYKKTR